MGHTISVEGIKPKAELGDSTINTPPPADKDQVRSFLSVAEFYCKFIPNFYVLAQPIKMLLKKNVKFEQSDECVRAFESFFFVLILPNILLGYTLVSLGLTRGNQTVDHKVRPEEWLPTSILLCPVPSPLQTRPAGE